MNLKKSMKFTKRSFVASSAHLTVRLLTIWPATSLLAQQPPSPVSITAPGRLDSLAQPMNWTAAEDHRNMMDQLGIKAMRPGPSGNDSAPNHANYDELKANPFPDLPDVLMLKDGKRVTTAEMWWKQRRPEIVEDFEREVYGRIPKYAPDVAWTVTSTVKAMVGSHAVIGKELVGRVKIRRTRRSTSRSTWHW